MKLTLSVLGVLATGVMLAVSAAMNWRFGFSLGRTELDGQIYGAASAAADCMKALAPFFFFAAIRARAWSQAAACAVVGIVVAAYSLTSALGHAALNRFDTAGQRASAAQTYKDNRADLARTKEQLAWIPQHRPEVTVLSEIEGAKTERAWRYTKGCTKITGPKGREFCQGYHGLMAELGSAQQAAVLEGRISELEAKLKDQDGATVMSEADPQAAVLTSIASLLIPDVKVEDVQMALTIFVALLLETGSAFGLYISLGHYYHGRAVKVAVPARAEERDDDGAQGDQDFDDMPNAVAANDQEVEALEDEPDEGASDRSTVVGIAQRRIEDFVRDFTVPAVKPADGTTGYELYALFVEAERAAGRSTKLVQRTFLTILGTVPGVTKQRIGTGHERKVVYLVKPAQGVPVSAAA